MGKKLIIKGADFYANCINDEPTPPAPLLQLYQGYCSAVTGNKIEIDVSASSNSIRVRSGELHGGYYVKVKSGYLIRAVTAYAPSAEPLTPGTHQMTSSSAMPNSTNVTEYTHTGVNYSIITFCKTNASQPISPDEDIIDIFEQS